MAWRALSLVAGVAALGAVAAANAEERGAHTVSLMRGLVEISGLAAAGDATVFAHNDEFAIIYELDVETGESVRAFALGDPTVADDFEGVAVNDGRIYLITSAGLLYEADIADHRQRARFNIYDTGVGAFCEIEGLSQSPRPGALLILCKRPRKSAPQDHLNIYEWRFADRRPATQPTISVAFRDFLPSSEREAFRPAGLEWDAARETLVVLSSRSHIVYEFDKTGAFLRKSRLPPSVHVQSEGVAVMPSGAFVIADEGVGRAPGQITLYPSLP